MFPSVGTGSPVTVAGSDENRGVEKEPGGGSEFGALRPRKRILVMRKSMFATAVVATAGLAASANAGFWSISGANYTNGVNINLPMTQVLNQVSTYVSSTFTGSPGNELSLTSGDVTNVLSNLGVTLVDNTLTYFGFEGSATGPGFFGIAFKNTSGSTYNLNMQAGSQSAGGSEGVLTTHAGTIGGFGTSWTSAASVTTGSTMLVMFGGLNAGVSFDFQTQSLTTSGGAGAAFAIEYLNWNGSGYVTLASAGTATSSGLNAALYQIPVPAPALLAGAGLVGAAALRRRMTKKA